MKLKKMPSDRLIACGKRLFFFGGGGMFAQLLQLKYKFLINTQLFQPAK